MITNMGFRGWPAEAIDFYDGLEEDNSKAYWQAHKAAYEQAVLRPMEELLDDLAAQYGPGRIFRPYRDVRFSADKSPYKTAIGATLGEAGYIRLSAAGLAAGRGMYMMSADQLQRYRQAVDADLPGPDLAQRVAAIRDAGIEVTAHDRVKDRAPRLSQGSSPDRPAVPEGARRLAGVAGLRVAGHDAGQGPPAGISRPGRAPRRMAGRPRRPEPVNLGSRRAGLGNRPS